MYLWVLEQNAAAKAFYAVAARVPHRAEGEAALLEHVPAGAPPAPGLPAGTAVRRLNGPIPPRPAGRCWWR
jgi:hypothetical protein